MENEFLTQLLRSRRDYGVNDPLDKIAASNCSEFDTAYRELVARNLEFKDAAGAFAASRSDNSRAVSFSALGGMSSAGRRFTIAMYKFMTVLMKCKKIPPRSQTKIQTLYKFSTNKRMDEILNLLRWYVDNQSLVEWVLTSKSWPELSNSGSEVSVGKFTLINQTDQDLDVPIKMLEAASKLVRASNVPGLSKVLYGDVLVVSSISNRRNVAAWYDYSKDEILLISAKRFDREKERILLHELGHRYWRKFADKNRIEEWKNHHFYLLSKKMELKPGDSIPFSPYIYLGLYPSGPYVRMMDTKKNAEVLISTRDYVDIKRSMAFPTPYSKTNIEEHFCEALSMYLMGTLDEDHLLEFERIWT